MGTYASIATMKEREQHLKATVESLLKNPFDHIYIYAHGYEESDPIPDFAQDTRIVFHKDPNAANGDADKFYFPDTMDLNGYVFTCDDDLVYPSNYVEVMVDKLNQYKGAVVSVLGHLYYNFPFTNYFNQEHRSCYGCLQTIVGDHAVNAVGTGVLAYHTDIIKPTMGMFPIPNMADIWFSLACQRREIPMMAIGHKNDFLKYADTLPLEETIAGQTLVKNEIQCAVINAYQNFHKWKVRHP